MKLALKLSTDNTLTDLDLDAPAGSLAVLQSGVGGWIEPVDLSEEVTMYCNEEGKLGDYLPNPIATIIFNTTFAPTRDIIMGDVVFTGGVDDEGDTLGLPAEAEAAIRDVVKIAGADNDED